jgi:hypothetical protein
VNRLEEQRTRILSLFDEQARSLRRLTLFFLLPALLFGLFIFLPFTEQVASASRFQLQLDSTQERLANTADSVAGVMAVDSLAQALRLGSRLRRDLDLRYELARMLMREPTLDSQLVHEWTTGTRAIDLSNDPRAMDLLGQGHGGSPCIWLDDRQWRDCFDVGGAELCIGRGCLVYPDYRSFVDGAPNGPLDEALARELLDSLSAVRRTIREDLAPVARAATESPISDPGYARARESFEGLRNRVAERRRMLRDTIAQLERDTAVLTSDLDRAQRLIHVIEQSGSSFETPLGPLPVGIRELVFLYPAILGIAYLGCMAAFRRLVVLRRGFHELTQSSAASNGEVTDVSSLRLTTPLWYDPLAPPMPQLGRALLALVPLAFMVWSYAALRSGLAAVGSGTDSRFGAGWYQAFFWLTLFAAIAALARAVWAVLDYARSTAVRPAP